MNEIHFTLTTMTLKAALQIKILVSAIAIASIFGWISVPVSAQPTIEPQPPTTPPPPEAASPPPQQTSYMGFGGVIGLQGQTTSLSQGSFSMFSKYVLSNNLALHSTSTIFASSVASPSLDLTFNQPFEK